MEPTNSFPVSAMQGHISRISRVPGSLAIAVPSQVEAGTVVFGGTVGSGNGVTVADLPGFQEIYGSAAMGNARRAAGPGVVPEASRLAQRSGSIGKTEGEARSDEASAELNSPAEFLEDPEPGSNDVPEPGQTFAIVHTGYRASEGADNSALPEEHSLKPASRPQPEQPGLHRHTDGRASPVLQSGVAETEVAGIPVGHRETGSKFKLPGKVLPRQQPLSGRQGASETSGDTTERKSEPAPKSRFGKSSVRPFHSRAT